MKEKARSAIPLLEELSERAKELTCLYAIEELLKDPEKDIDEVCRGILEAIPPGWQYPEICVAKITLEGKQCETEGFEETPWVLNADIVQQDEAVGSIRVHYTQERGTPDAGPFLKEEKKLIETIADRLGHFLVYRRMKHVLQEWEVARDDLSHSRKKDWEAVLDLLRQTDNALFLRIANKMLNHLCWSGVEEAEKLRRSVSPGEMEDGDLPGEAGKRSYPTRIIDFSTQFTERIFRLADQHLSGDEILSRVQMWIQEDKLSVLAQAVYGHLPLSELADALRRYSHTTPEAKGASYPILRGLKTALIRRVLSDRLDYVNLAKDYVEVEDIHHLLRRVVFSGDSHGRLGGPSAGLFLASQVLRNARDPSGVLTAVRIPKTWYISSDMMLHFMHFNNIDDVIEQKYKEIDRVRIEYPHIVETFARCVFPPEMEKGLSMALDDFGECPLVVKSSSLLEDCAGASFSGKYKSVLLANRGTKQERLNALMHAVAEVYASVFSPEPIEYRMDRGFLDFSEEMGIMIQEAVGTVVGSHFLPVCAGIAMSKNDFRWSPEIRRDDGFVRIVPGLRTPASDRACDDYPFLVAPGRPAIRLNTSTPEAVRYAPRKLCALNLENGSLEIVEVGRLVKKYGKEFPHLEQVVSAHEGGELLPLETREFDVEQDDLIVTFDGLISRSPFIVHIRTLLKHLEEKLGIPVEIEFASDGEQLYVLECRPQSYQEYARPTPIPGDIPPERVVFSARRNVPNGRLSNITHIVYVDPKRYRELEDETEICAVGRAVRRLNEFLPKRQFVLMGPGGSEDLPHGRAVRDYADIKNTAALIEIAPAGGNGGTRAFFGIHFFQDLIKSNIHYLPIDLGEDESAVNQAFVENARNLLGDVFPEFAFLSEVIRLIDIRDSTNGMVMQVLMNAELDEAVGVLAKPETELGAPGLTEPAEDGRSESYWRWRLAMAEHIASLLDPERFGVAGFYLIGSTKNGTAGPGSDIDVLLHLRGSRKQEEDLTLWLEGWSSCLAQVNYLQTGYRSKGLLDLHIVTDEDIARKTSYAVKIDAVTDAARPLQMKQV